jgi:hypothetical protein
VPPFLTKLYELVSSHQTDEWVLWNADQQSFSILDPDAFASKVLPHYFKHNKLSSFTQQLNIYGFRRRASSDVRGSSIEFHHPHFRPEDPQCLARIRRGVQPRTSTEDEERETLAEELMALTEQFDQVEKLFHNQQKHLLGQFEETCHLALQNFPWLASMLAGLADTSQVQPDSRMSAAEALMWGMQSKQTMQLDPAGQKRVSVDLEVQPTQSEAQDTGLEPPRRHAWQQLVKSALEAGSATEGGGEEGSRLETESTSSSHEPRSNSDGGGPSTSSSDRKDGQDGGNSDEGGGSTSSRDLKDDQKDETT